MLKIIEKPSPLMQKALQKFEQGVTAGKILANKKLKNGNVKIEYTETAGNLHAIDKIITKPYKTLRTRFIYDGKKLQRWIISEKTPNGEIKHKLMNTINSSSGEIFLPNRTFYTYSGHISNPKNIIKYGCGQKVSKDEFDNAIRFIRQMNAFKNYSIRLLI